MKRLAVRYRGQTIRADVIVTPRGKTIALKVHRDGTVTVRAPRFIKLPQLRQFVLRRAPWILERQLYFRDLARKHPGKELKNGETFPVLGRGLRLRLKRHPGLETPYCQIGNRRLEVVVDGQVGPELKAAMWSAIKSWYSALTEKKAAAIVRRHARALAVRPGKLKIADQTRRWASCSKSGEIRCNWRLSMMPMPTFEYVMVHELCHLKTHDHSLRFWRILKSVLPDYERRRDWLRREGLALTVGGA